MLRPPSAQDLAGIRWKLAESSPTYIQHCATKQSSLPSGYRHDRLTVRLGAGSGVWIAAKKALMQWKAHEHAGVEVTPHGAPLTVGTVVTGTTRVGPLWVVAPCRIVYVSDLSSRFGFAYGTLPGHPEVGEEAFHVVRDDHGSVYFEIVAFSRPAAVLARLGGPLSRALQLRTIRLYLDGVATFVNESLPGT